MLRPTSVTTMNGGAGPRQRAGRGRTGRPGCGRAAWPCPSRRYRGSCRSAWLRRRRHRGVEVDVAAADAAIGLADVHPALEHVAVVAGVAAGRLGRGQIEQGGEFGKEELVVGALAAPAPSQRAMKASSAEGVGREAGAGQAAAEVTRGSRVSVGKR